VVVAVDDHEAVLGVEAVGGPAGPGPFLVEDDQVLASMVESSSSSVRASCRTFAAVRSSRSHSRTSRRPASTSSLRIRTGPVSSSYLCCSRRMVSRVEAVEVSVADSCSSWVDVSEVWMLMLGARCNSSRPVFHWREAG
jgi:hypothetical protein